MIMALPVVVYFLNSDDLALSSCYVFSALTDWLEYLHHEIFQSNFFFAFLLFFPSFGFKVILLGTHACSCSLEFTSEEALPFAIARLINNFSTSEIKLFNPFSKSDDDSSKLEALEATFTNF